MENSSNSRVTEEWTLCLVELILMVGLAYTYGLSVGLFMRGAQYVFEMYWFSMTPGWEILMPTSEYTFWQKVLWFHLIVLYGWLPQVAIWLLDRVIRAFGYRRGNRRV